MSHLYARLCQAWQQRLWSEHWLLLEAFLWLGVARLLLVLLPFHWVMFVWQLHLQSQPEMPLAPTAYKALLQIRRAIGSASLYTPWHSTCLVQALAANRLLQRQQIGSCLYLGVALTMGQPLKAHAWLRCGEWFVTGEPGWQRFTPVAIFGADISAA